MKVKRSYRQYCGLAKALDVVGERWTLLIVRNLLLGPQHYSELLSGLPGITTNLLAQRLKEMEGNGLLEKVAQPEGGHAPYQLTQLGETLEPAILALGGWGWHAMAEPHAEDHMNLSWAMVSLKRRFTPIAGSWSVELVIGDRRFFLRPDDKRLIVELHSEKAMAVTVSISPELARQWFFQKASTAKLIAEGLLQFRGRKQAFSRFVSALNLEK